MSQMHVPVPDTSDETDQLQSLEVTLTPHQIEWLKQRAEERGLSLDHVLRSIITAQIRDTNEDPSPSSAPGDGAPRSSGGDPSSSTTAEEDPPSIVESLRSASERLQALTDDEDDADRSDLRDTIARLQDRVDPSTDEPESDEAPTATDDSSDGAFPEDQGRSMFDLVEE